MSTELARMKGEAFLDGISAFTGTAVRRLKATIRDHRVAWAIAVALLGIAVPVLVGLVLKAQGLIHGASLHAGLLDAGSNVNKGGWWGSWGSGAAGGSGDDNVFGPGQYGPFGNPWPSSAGKAPPGWYIGYDRGHGQVAPEPARRFADPTPIADKIDTILHQIVGDQETTMANAIDKA